LMIISGMAWGIDAEAHRAAIDVGGITSAIFGCGIDIIYPGTHRDLAHKILQNGFWLSEFPFGTQPERHNFPRRNRIISGLSQAVVIVEAAAKSGALVTANLAIEQGRDVFAVPGQVDNPMSGGTINLLKQGASVATSAEDILESLGWEISQQIKQTEKKHKPITIKLEPDEQKVCDFIGKGPAHFDELVRKLGYPPAKVSAILLKLELSGLAVRRPGNYVTRA
jgi:DNA processing protein